VRKLTIETTVRVKNPHRTGQLARLATAVAESGSIIGDVTTVSIGEHESVRDVTIETADDAHTQLVLDAIRALPNFEILSTSDLVFERHRGGKLRVQSRVDVKALRDLRLIYTPGVARVSRAIQKDPELAWELTGIGNSVGIFTNGSRVLGLGDIGPVASLPVMEGKAALYEKFAGLSATPILVDTLDADVFVETVARLAHSFGGIHLEDIRIPECFRIEKELDRRLDKPVMHDDQHGTAIAALAAVINACRITGKDLKRSVLGQIGLGAAGSAIARLALAYGVGKVLVTDVSEASREALRNAGAVPVSLDELMASVDIVVATTGKPRLIAADKVKKGQVIFALSNPDPEIDPDEAMNAGAAFAGDGRSINNALAFPGLFKGALDVRSKAITPAMRVAAAEVIASLAPPGEVVPSPLDPRVHEAVTRATVETAQREGLAGTARV
jgi:malate dehydrogenase (oxaloacetate-decarboxylating)